MATSPTPMLAIDQGLIRVEDDVAQAVARQGGEV
jgi:hypothetical protein